MSNELEIDDKTVEAVSSGTRKNILKYLNRRNMTVTELSRELDLSKSTVHEHLSKLLEAGFINKLDREGRKWVYYELTKKGKNLVGNRVKNVLLFASSIVAGVLGIQQLHSYFTTKRTMEDAVDIGPMTETHEATETITEVTNGNIHLAAAIILFIVTATLILYYFKKVR